MMTHRSKIRRRLRSVRVAALTAEERRGELQATEKVTQRDDRPTPGVGAARGAASASRADTP